ncbi:MAG: LacI family transcriptional regulator [Pseudothermotoga sp.]|nr:LacI family transcriptional regulator [Pseudothermotoga sp.]
MATVEEVAKMARVSTATVSRVLNNSGYVSEKTRLKVWQAMRKLGYKPQISARALASKRLFHVAVVISQRIANLLASEVGVFYDVVLSSINDNEEFFRFNTTVVMLERIPQKNFDGYLIIGSDASEEQIKPLEKMGKIVLVDHYIDGLGIDCILSDGYDGIFRVTERFINKGIKNIIHLHGPLKYYGFKDRYTGYIAAMQKHSLLPICYEYDDLNEEVEPVLRKILRDRKPEVILCSNDIIAIKVLRKLREWKYRIPEEISVVGFDDIPQAEAESLSTLRVQKYEMGFNAVKRLYELLMGHSHHPFRLCLYTMFVKRDSSI